MPNLAQDVGEQVCSVVHTGWWWCCLRTCHSRTNDNPKEAVGSMRSPAERYNRFSAPFGHGWNRYNANEDNSREKRNVEVVRTTAPAMLESKFGCGCVKHRNRCGFHWLGLIGNSITYPLGRIFWWCGSRGNRCPPESFGRIHTLDCICASAFCSTPTMHSPGGTTHVTGGSRIQRPASNWSNSS